MPKNLAKSPPFGLYLGKDKPLTPANDELQSQLATYNESLSFVDRALSVVRDTEKEIRVLSERMLIAVAAKYGKDSYECEMAGGVRKRSTRRVDSVA